MAEHDIDSQTRPSTFSLPFRPRVSHDDGSCDGEKFRSMASAAQTQSPTDLPSPGISVEFHGDHDARPLATTHQYAARSAPADMQQQQFKSPLRHHRRTPSAHREVKETLNARSEYLSDDSDGRSHFRVNQYDIKEEIGRGSYGAVHLATDQFGNEYAVKEFSKARLRKRAQSEILRRGPKHLGRFPPRAGFGAPDVAHSRMTDQEAREASDALFLIREEIAIMKKLNHPNLVQLIEVLDDPEEDSLYMVLEMCKKGVVMKVGLNEPASPYPEETCRCWFRDLILGIEYLHRDIKPDNLLLTSDDVLKIVDFGVSEMFEKAANMRTAKSAGSPAFLPPELCVAKHGDVSGKAADIWSMGVSLYCLRYGRIPFEKPGVLEIYEAIRTESPQFPPGENEQFADLMNRLMEKDPEKRITMAELRVKNLSDPVEPNALEVNHAFTRRMSHLLCVMKAIKKFKALPPALPETTGQPTRSPEESTEEHAARIILERQLFLQTTRAGRSPNNTLASGDKGHAHEPTDVEPLHLGIGTGNMDDFSGYDKQSVNVVSDSPTAVDFDVYDRAFNAEVDRIKRSTSRKGKGQSEGGAATPLYHTKLNKPSGYRTGDENLAWADNSGESTPRQLLARPPQQRAAGPKLADLVSMMTDGKEAAKLQKPEATAS
ncbi:kinase-like domain-containing protein [Podospora appendiculata]|uniref:Kinase-like domain-containing protein n=1 Tax=Podospora appendiculata TaxID=314037 RepID=A0AAE0XFN0_9PEZI|nr:kinase-like domain-containing protein [Podospora appendiculata]